MKNLLKKSILALVFTGFLAAAPMLSLADTQAPGGQQSQQPSTYIVKQVRHELLMLPYYGVFDNLEYTVEGNHVELLGQVVDPVLKSSAANVVKKIEGVESVSNQIQVLPVSSFDDQIRLAEYRAIFGRDGLYRYAMGANPSIHIIVNRGNVTLVGQVGTQMDKTLAGMQANSVAGVFSVTNNLHIG